MEDYLYYTLSTISQVLTGAIALLGVFCLFKIEQINNSMKGIGKAVLIEFRENEEARKEVTEENRLLISRVEKQICLEDYEVLKIVLKEIVDIIGNESFKVHVEQRYNQKENDRDNLIQQTKKIILHSAFTILLSLSILAFSHAFTNEFIFLVWPILIIFFLFIFILCKTIKMIYSTLEIR